MERGDISGFFLFLKNNGQSKRRGDVMETINKVLRYGMIVIVSAGLTVGILIQPGHSQDQPREKVVLSLQWLTQCQFAGYYVALKKGFYKEEGIDLTILPGATDINPIFQVSSKTADFGTKWLADFIAAKSTGAPLISIAQVLQSNGLILIAKSKSGIRTPYDFIGKQVGIWFFGNETQFFAMMNKLELPLDKIEIGTLKWSIKPFLNNEFDVIMAMIYNEYLRVLDSGYTEDEINIIDFAQYGLNFPGQVIFTHKSILENRPELCERMVRASLKGWAWAMEHPEAAVDIVLQYDETRTLEKKHQLEQMKHIVKLIQYGDRPLGHHSPEQVAFVMKSLVENNVIQNELDLEQVYTNQIWEKVKSPGK